MVLIHIQIAMQQSAVLIAINLSVFFCRESGNSMVLQALALMDQRAPLECRNFAGISSFSQ